MIADEITRSAGSHSLIEPPLNCMLVNLGSMFGILLACFKIENQSYRRSW